MTQRMISIKSVNDLPDVFKDKVQFQVTDNNVEAVVFTLGDETIRVVTNGSYSNNLKVLQSQPKKEVTKYKLSGGIAGIAGMQMQPEMFDSGYDADEKRKGYERKFDYNEVDLKIEPVVEFVEEDKI